MCMSEYIKPTANAIERDVRKFWSVSKTMDPLVKKYFNEKHPDDHMFINWNFSETNDNIRITILYRIIEYNPWVRQSFDIIEEYVSLEDILCMIDI